MTDRVLAAMVWVRRRGLAVIEGLALLVAVGGLAVGATGVSGVGFLVLGFTVPWHAGMIVRRRFAGR